MTLPLKPAVMQSVWRIISSNTSVRTVALSGSNRLGTISELPGPVDLYALAGVRREPTSKRPTGSKKAVAAADSSASRERVQITLAFGKVPPPPAVRRLKVFSFDPLLAADPESLGMESVVLKLDWDEESADGAKLQPGPVGEYLEVVDYDPGSRCFYPPVDLNHPNLLAQDGMPLSETDPQFHQQMVYAVGMKTIAVFERALGRTVLWSPHLVYDEKGRVESETGRLDGEFVRRLRIYPHAMRAANAYYDPNRKALLFGYFSANALPGDKVCRKGLCSPAFVRRHRP